MTDTTQPPVQTLAIIEMLQAAEVQEGVTVFDHSAEEIGIAVMENHCAILAALTRRAGGDDAEQEALAGYRAAVSFVAADSWDGCSDCIDTLKAARVADWQNEQAADPDETARQLARIRAHRPPVEPRAGGDAIPAGMKPWHGGDAAPEDIGEASEVMHADGSIGLANKRSILWGRPKRKVGASTDWERLGPRLEAKWIIAYTPKPPAGGDAVAVERYRQALEDVCNPISYLQRLAEAEGAKLGGMAYSIANDIATVQRIARAALALPAPVVEGTFTVENTAGEFVASFSTRLLADFFVSEGGECYRHRAEQTHGAD